MEQPTLEQTIVFATQKHEKQLDKQGQPYILHVLRVMLRLQDPDDRIVGLLHDVVEDCEVTAEMLRAIGYTEHIITDVLCVSKRPDEMGAQNYGAFIERIATTGSQRAIRVKLADLRDNADPNRMLDTHEANIQRIHRYEEAIARLRLFLTK